MLAIQPPTMQAQEDLAALFSRNLTLDPSQQAAPPPPPQPEEPKIVYSISQHYHHSAHIARHAPPHEAEQVPRPASEPPQAEYQATDLILVAHGVDPTSLSASQRSLFRAADDAQKLRLIELWNIAPPTIAIDHPALALPTTTLEQEEALAQLRYERKAAETAALQEQQQNPTAMSLDGTQVPVVQSGDGRWGPQQHQSVEPYMASGYEELARREYDTENSRPRVGQYSGHFGSAAAAAAAGGYSSAMDPVWQTTNVGVDYMAQKRAMEMENQYGMLMAMRGNEMEL